MHVVLTYADGIIKLLFLFIKKIKIVNVLQGMCSAFCSVYVNTMHFISAYHFITLLTQLLLLVKLSLC